MGNNLLIVDDEENILNALRRLFRREQFNVLIAKSAQEGLDILNRENISVILSDQRMPGMIGSDFFKIVKEKHPATIRIIMSGYTELESITSAINDGAVYKFLLKPWDDEKLTHHIREAFLSYELKEKNITLNKEINILNQKLSNKLEEEEIKNEFNVRTITMAQQLLDKIPMAVLSVTTDGLIVMANEYAKALINRKDIIGNQIEAIFPPEICRAIETNNDSTETQLEWLPINKTVRITPIKNNGGGYYFCIAILQIKEIKD
jgi:response regulator RpfG family c-di-GMP phosphodiesterase